MKKENNITSEGRKSGYLAPATRVINIGMRQAVLTETSPNEPGW